MSGMRSHSTGLPEVFVTVREDGRGEVVVGAERHAITETSLFGARRAATLLVVDRAARRFGGPVRARTSDPDGDGELIVYPDGTVEVDHHVPDRAQASSAPAVNAESFRQPEGAEHGGRIWWPPAQRQATAGGATVAAADSLSGEPGWSPTPARVVGRSPRPSFLAADVGADQPTIGLRGVLARSGVRTQPSRREQALRDDVRLVSQHWSGPRTIAVANPKGSANKTPTTLCLSAVFGRYGGGGVLAWDNNETRGTAAWRTRPGPHEATVLDLLPRTDELLAAGARAAELAGHVHHQADDKFDVLWSDQSTRGDHEVTGDEVHAVHEVASKYYRLIVMDSGNSERAGNWRAMVGHADALVVPATNVEDTAEAGARMLEALASRDEHSADLARNAVAIISQRTPGRDRNLRRIAEGFAPLVRAVVTIPHDPALYSGVIRFDSLRPPTQRAWLAAAAAVAEAL
jgi:MinD-like ATPase involved in chromosome partitioning or flagellar assembly